MTRGQELKQLLKLHHQARGILLSLDGDYGAEIAEKDKLIRRFEYELKSISQAELDREIDLYASPIQRAKVAAAGH